MESNQQKGNSLEKATLGAGCFWCVEAVFQELDGVESVIPGYTGGTSANPTYEEVCSGTTGHAEVAEITYDPEKISFEDILEVFFKTHDPTTLNKQGGDIGTQYRSSIFYHNEAQRKIAEAIKEELNASSVFGDPVVTEISPLGEFYEAEDYHRDYYERNPAQPYCSYVVRPKVEKVRALFKDRLKVGE